ATIMHDLIHTRLEVSFDWANQRLLGSEEITLKPHFYPQKELYLNAKGMDINEVKLMKGEIKTELAYEYTNDSIRITLDKIYTARDTFKIFIDYVSKPEELPVGGSAAITSDKGLYFINADKSDPEKPQQIWTQGETQASSVWFPTIDHPNQKCTEEIYITVDTAFVTLSNGIKVSSIVNTGNGTRTDYWRQNLPNSPYLFMMAIGKYAIVKDHWRNKEVSYYVEPEFEKYARNIFGNTPEMIEFFSQKLGVDYVWEKYSEVVVRDYVSGAMENTTATVFGEFMNQDNRERLDRNYEDVISHELFHHWFGDLVTMESWANLPLNESFATYGEYLWNEYKYGREEADYNFQHDLNSYLREARSKQVDLIRYDYKKRDDMFDSHSYAKGGRVLHMLRKYTGDEAFFASLKLYLEKNKFKPVEIHNLRLAFEEVTGEDLNWFFNEWFLDKGHPSIKIDYSYDAENKKELMKVEQLQNLETTPLYKLPVDIDIYSGSAVKHIRINVTKQSETFTFDAPVQPELVNFDSQKMLLCTKVDNHTNAEWITMFNKGPLYLDKYEALSKLSKEYGPNSPEAEVIRKALDDPFWNIRLTAVKNSKGLATANSFLLKQKLLTMASADKKAAVREAALTMLSEIYKNDNEVNDAMRNAVKDSSYNVMETAFNYILENNNKEGLLMVAKLQSENNRNISQMISGFYANYGGDDQYEYMTNEMKKTDGFAKYASIMEYGKFLQQCSPDFTLKGLENINEVALNHSMWYVRFSAAQAISSLAKSYGKKDDLKEVNNQAVTVSDEKAEIIRKKAFEYLGVIKTKETDPNLIKIYRKE
ncbi:MAG: M1 family metallopeptidase, partial [Ferruginibacter sp.]